jgi:hypothetical protein
LHETPCYMRFCFGFRNRLESVLLAACSCCN